MDQGKKEEINLDLILQILKGTKTDLTINQSISYLNAAPRVIGHGSGIYQYLNICLPRDLITVINWQI